MIRDLDAPGEPVGEQNEVLRAWRLLKYVIGDKVKKLVPINDFAAGEIAAYKSVMEKIDELIQMEIK